jgi:hypothetical protein
MTTQYHAELNAEIIFVEPIIGFHRRSLSQITYALRPEEETARAALCNRKGIRVRPLRLSITIAPRAVNLVESKPRSISTSIFHTLPVSNPFQYMFISLCAATRRSMIKLCISVTDAQAHRLLKSRAGFQHGRDEMTHA